MTLGPATMRGFFLRTFFSRLPWRRPETRGRINAMPGMHDQPQRARALATKTPNCWRSVSSVTVGILQPR